MKKRKVVSVKYTLGKMGTAYVHIDWKDYWNVDSCTVTKVDGTVVAEGLTAKEAHRIADEVLSHEFHKDLGIGGGQLSAALDGLDLSQNSGPGGLTAIFNVKPVEE